MKLTTNSPKIIQRRRRICGDRGSLSYEPLAGAWTPLHQFLDGLNKSDVELQAKRAAAECKIVYASTGGEVLRQQILTAYLDLEKRCKKGLFVAACSSRFLFTVQPAGL